jgi:serine/threonine-protein kinase
LTHDGVDLTANYLVGGQATLTNVLAHMKRSSDDVSSLSAYGSYLDDSGRIADGGKVWNTRLVGRSAAGVIAESDQWLVAQGALNRALVGNCSSALEMAKAALSGAQRQGMSTNFAAGMGAALCGNGDLAQRTIDAISSDWPQSTVAKGYELPELRAAVALGQHDPQVAFDALLAVQKDDPALLTPYLRGLAHIGLHQTQFGISDFQSVLGHRGAALVGGSNVFPVALSTLASAYAESGDMYDSVQANRRLLEMWRGADASVRQGVASRN